MTFRGAFVAMCAVVLTTLAACGARSSLDEDAANGAPRPIAPLSSSRVTSRRPTLRWALPLGVAGAILDLCLDRACTKPIGAPVHVDGASYAPESDLPIGVVYWRLRSSTHEAVTSPTWQFSVGARSAAIDTSWGTTLDVNGDGYADLVVGALDAPSLGGGRAYVYLGSAGGLATAPAVTLTGPDGGFFGYSVASAGDVNGDGYADLVVGAYAAVGFTGRVYVYLGGAKGLSTRPAMTLTGPDGALGSFGDSVASAGDVNGDGYADLVVGAYALNATGRAYVYLGSATGLALSPAVTLLGPGGVGDAFGIVVASAGDVNGDGYADFAVGALGTNALGANGSAQYTTVQIYVYLGSATGIVAVPATTLNEPSGDCWPYGFSLAGAGDVNGDGYADLVVGVDGTDLTGRADVYLGGATGLSAAPATTLTGRVGRSECYPDFTVAIAGDTDGDGYTDVIVTGYDLPDGIERAYVYLGSATGLAAAPVAALTASHDGAGAFDYGAGAFDYQVACAGDVNGDGYADLAVGAEWASPSGSAFVYLGGATGLAAPPATALVGPDGPHGYFGVSVFGASD